MAVTATHLHSLQTCMLYLNKITLVYTFISGKLFGFVTGRGAGLVYRLDSLYTSQILHESAFNMCYRMNECIA